ncbi:Uma2 family endonuclease [Ilyomonas limi]|uniref:Uma2 family endonuclease n=1 Tax=Ilyomonas limi TaxID=2575867 RepID=A0A4U3KZI2_9BACT|nr:Uma2 family endonuclease [Ilyomonas limi]TKK68085.1 Uma2 family endonuclease [Ilyomonas limi]
MDVLIEELKQKPNLKILVNELTQILQEEEQRRMEFYNHISESDKAEFINGEVIMHSPAKREHLGVTGLLFSLMHYYAIMKKCGSVFTEKAMIQLTRNSYEPDIVFFKKAKADAFTPGQMLFPAPDLIVEVVSPSTEKYDRGIKFTDYALHGVSEYWIVDPAQKSAEQYFLQGDAYVLEFKGKTGSITSKAIADFTIPVQAVFDETENMKVLQQIMQA